MVPRGNDWLQFFPENHSQKVTWNASEQAGHSILRFPGRGRTRKLRSHEGHEISILTTLRVILNTLSQDEQRSAQGRSGTPTRRIFGQFGQPTFSSSHASRVGLCSMREIDEQTPHLISPSS